MPEFFYFWTYWLIVAVALAVCVAVGALLYGWVGALFGGTLYIVHESVVFGPRRNEASP